jgi:hypothetical protein
MVARVGKPCWSYDVTTSREADAKADDEATEDDEDGDG